MRVWFLMAASAVLAGAAQPSVEIWSAGDIKQTSTGLESAAEAKGLEGKTLGSFGNHSTAI